MSSENIEDKNEKEYLLKEIESLISIGGDSQILIDPKYLDFLTTEELYSIKELLEDKKDSIVDDNINWLKGFKKS